MINKSINKRLRFHIFCNILRDEVIITSIHSYILNYIQLYIIVGHLPYFINKE